MIRFLRDLPLLILIPLNLFVLFLFILDLVLLDPLPLVDEIFLGALLYMVIGSMLLKLRSPAGAEKKAGADTREAYEKLRDITRLIKEIRRTIRGRFTDLPELDSERLKDVRSRVRRLRQTLKRLDAILSSAPFGEAVARQEVRDLEERVNTTGHARRGQDLKEALHSAREHLDNICKLKEDRESLAVKTEKLYQQLKQTRSFLAGLEVKSVDVDEISRKIDEIHTSVNELDQIYKEVDQLFSTAAATEGSVDQRSRKRAHQEARRIRLRSDSTDRG